METISSLEAEMHPSQLLDRVANGEEFAITGHGKPVAKLVAFAPATTRRDIRQAVEELKAFRKGNVLGEGITIREMIDEGRRC